MNVGLIYIEVGGGVNTAVAISNPNNEAVTMTWGFPLISGSPVGASPRFTVPPNEQIAFFLNEPPYNSGLSPDKESARDIVYFTSTRPVSVMALRTRINERSEFLMEALPVWSPDSFRNQTQVVLPYYATGNGWTTDVLVMNPCGGPTNVTIDFMYSMPNSHQIYMHSQASLSGGVYRKSVPALVPNTLSTGWITVFGGPCFTAMAIATHTVDGIVTSESVIPPAPIASSFTMYAEASGIVSGRDGLQLGVAIVNLSQLQQDMTVNFELTGMDGNTVKTGSIKLLALEQTTLALNQIRGFDILPQDFRGVLRITAPGRMAVLGLRSHYNERGEVLLNSIMPTDASSLAQLGQFVFPHFAAGGGYNMQFVLFSPLEVSISGTISFFAPSGNAESLALH
jgi:hypothetical protein